MKAEIRKCVLSLNSWRGGSLEYWRLLVEMEEVAMTLFRTHGGVAGATMTLWYARSRTDLISPLS